VSRSATKPLSASLHTNGLPRPRPRATLLGGVALPLLVALACNERPADLREWRVSDHNHTESPNSGQVQVDPSASAQAPPGLEDVTIVAWQQNCTRCHGQLGRGDGPQGPMVKATNLSDPAWQKAATDEQIGRAIKEGKGAMPAFKLPDATIGKLVKLVRMMNADQPGPGGASSAAPSASAASSSAPSASAPAKPRVSPGVAAPAAAPAPKPSGAAP
jgi:cytochrome c oxidase cbb3-type subunit 3